MTWGRLQKLTEALLTGDYNFPKDIEARIALLQYALEEITDLSEPTQLESTDLSVEKVRSGYNGVVYRRANLPDNDTEEMDIDIGLCFACARLMASYISKEKFNLHRNMAIELLNRYTAKIESFREDNAVYGKYDEKTYIKADQYE